MNNSSAASTLLVSPPEQLMHPIAHRRPGLASRLLMTRPRYHTVTWKNPDIFRSLNIDGIFPYTQRRAVKERQAIASSRLSPTASWKQGSTSVCKA
jgi:hypothetical protein